MKNNGKELQLNGKMCSVWFSVNVNLDKKHRQFSQCVIYSV